MSMRALKADIPVPLAERLEQLAGRMSRTTDSVVREALADWVEREERERRLIEEGLADVDAGRVVDHEKVRAWADSLTSSSALPVPRSG